MWIGLEGIGGAGKTTQAALVRDLLRRRYPRLRIATSSEFGDLPLGAYVAGSAAGGRLRLAPDGSDLSFVRHLLALGSRVEKLHRAAADRRWDVMVFDVGTLSDVAHALADLPADATAELRRHLSTAVATVLGAAAARLDGRGLPVFLACRPETAVRRLTGRLGRPVSAEEVRFLRRLAHAYDEVLAGSGAIRVDGERPCRQVTDEILAAVGSVLAATFGAAPLDRARRRRTGT